MALIQCNECGKQVSNNAMQCPNCGNQIQQQIQKQLVQHYEQENKIGCGRVIEFLLGLITLIFCIFYFYDKYVK
jgi:uncharacterized membrane protein YvbJ